MSTCEQILELMSAELDGELNLEEQTELDNHLAYCEACRSLYEDLAGIHLAMGGLVTPAPEGFSLRIREQIGAAVPASAPRIHWRAWTAVAAALVVVVGIGALTIPQWLGGRPGVPLMSTVSGGALAPAAAAPQGAPEHAVADEKEVHAWGSNVYGTLGGAEDAGEGGEASLRVAEAEEAPAAKLAQDAPEPNPAPATTFTGAVTPDAPVTSPEPSATPPEPSVAPAVEPQAEPAPDVAVATTALPDMGDVGLRTFAMVEEPDDTGLPPDDTGAISVAEPPPESEEELTFSAEQENALSLVFSLDLTPAGALELLYDHIAAGGGDLPPGEPLEGDAIRLITGEGAPGDSVRFGSRVLEYRAPSEGGGWYCFWYYRTGQGYGQGAAEELVILNRYAVNRVTGEVIPEWHYTPEQTNNWDAYNAALQE